MSVLFEALENKTKPVEYTPNFSEIRVGKYIITNQPSERICERCARRVHQIKYQDQFVSAKFGLSKQGHRYCSDCIRTGKIKGLNVSHLNLFLENQVSNHE